MQTNQTLFVSLLLGSATTVLAQTDTVGYIRTVAGISDPSVLRPAAVAVDGAGNLYIAEADNNLVTKWMPDAGLQPVAGNMNAGDSGDEGPAAAATFIAPGGVAVDRAGNVYSADPGNLLYVWLPPTGSFTISPVRGPKGSTVTVDQRLGRPGFFQAG